MPLYVNGRMQGLFGSGPPLVRHTKNLKIVTMKDDG